MDLDEILEMSKEVRNEFSQTIPVTIKISKAHFDFLKEDYYKEVRKSEFLAAKKLLKDLENMTDEESQIFLIGRCVRDKVNEIVKKHMIESFPELKGIYEKIN